MQWLENILYMDENSYGKKAVNAAPELTKFLGMVNPCDVSDTHTEKISLI